MLTQKIWCQLWNVSDNIWVNFYMLAADNTAQSMHTALQNWNIMFIWKKTEETKQPPKNDQNEKEKKITERERDQQNTKWN